MKSITGLYISGLVILLGARGSGAPGGGTGGTGSDDGTGGFTLKITDAPIDDANKVVVEIIGAQLRSKALTEPLVFDFASKSIDLLDLQGVSTETLIDNQPVPAGTYH